MSINKKVLLALPRGLLVCGNNAIQQINLLPTEMYRAHMCATTLSRHKIRVYKIGKFKHQNIYGGDELISLMFT